MTRWKAAVTTTCLASFSPACNVQPHLSWWPAWVNPLLHELEPCHSLPTSAPSGEWSYFIYFCFALFKIELWSSLWLCRFSLGVLVSCHIDRLPNGCLSVYVASQWADDLSRMWPFRCPIDSLDTTGHQQNASENGAENEWINERYDRLNLLCSCCLPASSTDASHQWRFVRDDAKLKNFVSWNR